MNLHFFFICVWLIFLFLDLYKICFHGVTILTISTIIPSLHPPKCIRDATRRCMSANNMQLMVLYIALYTTSLGIGGLKSSVSGFSTDQFDDSDKGEKKQMLKFFNWFVFFISLGTLTAVTVLVYIQDHIGRYWGYGISVCAMLVALLVLLSSTRRYRYKRLVGRVFIFLSTNPNY